MTPPSQHFNSNGLTPHDIESLERATVDAVAPPHTQEIDGWLLPMDHATIGRARSAVPLRHAGLDPQALRSIASAYRQWGIPARFRIADRPGLDTIQERLYEMGYTPEQPTLVQTGTVASLLALPVVGSATVESSPSDQWAAVYTAPGFDPVDGANRVQALSRSLYTVYASVHRDGQALAAGTASLSQTWASIHGMRTVPGARGRGLASQVLRALAEAAAQRGFKRVFLQVEENNRAALALYARAGFATAWRYRYWRDSCC
ncbi:MAG: GNAT family N-acetyltransferase [Burkholderiales bacterium PBB4]|nr:MAG: GNAT family N-acetyltransferase [Burkholderiales bacterium PBB4]